jgi:hypothetical protein
LAHAGPAGLLQDAQRVATSIDDPLPGCQEASSIGGLRIGQEWWGGVRGADGRQRWNRAVVTGDDGGYDEARAVHNGMFGTLAFVGAKSNVALRPARSRQTMLAVASAVTACQAGLSIYFTIGGGGEATGRSSDYIWGD